MSVGAVNEELEDINDALSVIVNRLEDLVGPQPGPVEVGEVCKEPEGAFERMRLRAQAAHCKIRRIAQQIDRAEEVLLFPRCEEAPSSCSTTVIQGTDQVTYCNYS